MLWPWNSTFSPDLYIIFHEKPTFHSCWSISLRIQTISNFWKWKFPFFVRTLETEVMCKIYCKLQVPTFHDPLFLRCNQESTKNKNRSPNKSEKGKNDFGLNVLHTWKLLKACLFFLQRALNPPHMNMPEPLSERNRIFQTSVGLNLLLPGSLFQIFCVVIFQ